MNKDKLEKIIKLERLKLSAEKDFSTAVLILNSLANDEEAWDEYYIKVKDCRDIFVHFQSEINKAKKESMEINGRANDEC